MKKHARFYSVTVVVAVLLVSILCLPSQIFAYSGARTTQQQVSFKGTRNAESQYARYYTAFPSKISKNMTPSVAQVYVLDRSIKGHPMYIIVFRFKKNKPARVTVEQTTAGGKKSSYDLTMNPISYTSPAKSVVIDGKAYFSGNTWIQESNKALNGKIKVVAKKNWKILGIYKFNTNQWNNSDLKLKYFKNGGKIRVKKNERMVIKFENKKTHQIFNMFYDCGFNHTK